MADISKSAITKRSIAKYGKTPSRAAVARTQAKDRAHLAALKAQPRQAAGVPGASLRDVAARSQAMRQISAKVSIPKGEKIAPIPQIRPGGAGGTIAKAVKAPQPAKPATPRRIAPSTPRGYQIPKQR